MSHQTTLDIFGGVQRRAVLISLREPWHRRILDGVKTYEFRRKFLSEPVEAFVYVGGSIRGICAVADLGRPVIGTPSEIARIAEDLNPGSTDALMAYLGNRPRGFAVPIESYLPIRSVSIDEARRAHPKFAPPQSYMYLDTVPLLLDVLRARREEAEL